MGEQVRQRQVGQVDVGGRLHVLVAPDDGADGGVSQDADGADAGVHRGDGDDGRQGQVPRPQAAGDVEVLKKGFLFLNLICATCLSSTFGNEWDKLRLTRETSVVISSAADPLPKPPGRSVVVVAFPSIFQDKTSLFGVDVSPSPAYLIPRFSLPFPTPTNVLCFSASR